MPRCGANRFRGRRHVYYNRRPEGAHDLSLGKYGMPEITTNNLLLLLKSSSLFCVCLVIVTLCNG